MGLFDADDLRRVATTLGQLAAVATGVLVLTGVPLVVAYDPGAPGWLSGLHGLASALLLGSSVGLLGCVAVARVRRAPIAVGLLMAFAGLAVAVAGAATGQVLRWTGLEPPDDGARGLIGPLTGDAEAVIVGSGELSPGGFLLWSLVHVVVVPASVGGVTVWFLRRRRAPAASGAIDPGGDPTTP
jgi:hypothetical protein